MQLFDYIKEHYNYPNVVGAAAVYTKNLLAQNAKVIQRDYGFIVYRFEGDACIVTDVYTTKEARKTGKGIELVSELTKIVQANENCHVVIGFSEKDTFNTHDGIGFMKAVGFKPYLELQDKTVYIRGTN